LKRTPGEACALDAPRVPTRSPDACLISEAQTSDDRPTDVVCRGNADGKLVTSGIENATTPP
jgi:hypothetical protein